MKARESETGGDKQNARLEKRERGKGKGGIVE